MKASVTLQSSIKKVCVIGPECTGKTDLSQYLSTYYKTSWVSEYARAYLNKLSRPYQQSDLTKIAHGQVRMEDEWINEANKVLICDTNLLVIKIWSEYKYGNCDNEIVQLLANRKYDLYLLTAIDIPWEDDPQREHPDKREFFWNLYKKEVATRGVATVEIFGNREERRAKAIEAINTLMFS
jgi:NadR type nicotinamide-nucleotide adenylyltransferase